MSREGAGGWVVLPSPAKVNLDLRILGVRPDGFHEVETWMQQIDWFDRVWIRPGGRVIRVTAAGGRAPSGRENLAHRAAAALRRAAGGGALGARIHLEKRIPAGAGLGGGSGNAAAVLRALNRLWGTGLPPAALRRIGAELGSDVPFFLGGPAALCRGRGERVSPRRPLGRGWILVAVPPFALSTARVYGWMRKKLICAGDASRMAVRPRSPLAPQFQNDLEEVVFERYPALRACRDALLAGGAERALMSGSGAAVLGLFGRMGAAEAAAGRIAARRGWAAHVARPLTRRARGGASPGDGGQTLP